MTQEQIEKAAGEISYHPFIEIERQGFIRGANWRIKSVWHKNTEIHDRNMDVYGCGEACLVKLPNESIDFVEALYDCDEERFYFSGQREVYLMGDIVSFAYINDLLPEE